MNNVTTLAALKSGVTRTRTNRILLCTLALAMLSGCASYYGAARITSEPSGAEVINLKDGTILGVTPTTVWWKTGSSDRQHISLRLKLDGYYDKVAPFWLSMRHKSQSEAMDSPQVVETVLQQRGD